MAVPVVAGKLCYKWVGVNIQLHFVAGRKLQLNADICTCQQQVQR